MVRADTSSREELKQSFLKETEICIGKVKYKPRVVYGEALCFKCDFLKVKGMFPILIRNRVCSCCLEADRYLTKLYYSHILKKKGEIQIEDEKERENTVCDEDVI